MKAILIKQKGGPENMVVTNYEDPKLREGFVLIEIKAFGLNRAEIYMRKGDWGETADVIGIECVGIVAEDPSGEFKKGQQVAAFVGGLARDLNGSYAEYTQVPKANVIPFSSKLSWNELAAIPESYATAWAILNWCLEIKQNDVLLVRGGTSTVGMAGIILAKQMGLKVIATTRSAEKVVILKSLGADHILIDHGKIFDQLAALYPDGVNCVIELVGNSTLEDSLACTSIMGSVCLAGFLGGLKPIENFQPIFQIPRSISLTTLGSAFSFGQKGFEFSKIPLQKIITDIEEGRIENIIRKTFDVHDIEQAHRLVEANEVNGKVVVKW
jgi:NADPH:quinone reductase-like Zn-dependent oxidoreductase